MSFRQSKATRNLKKRALVIPTERSDEGSQKTTKEEIFSGKPSTARLPFGRNDNNSEVYMTITTYLSFFGQALNSTTEPCVKACFDKPCRNWSRAVQRSCTAWVAISKDCQRISKQPQNTTSRHHHFYQIFVKLFPKTSFFTPKYSKIVFLCLYLQN